MTAYYNEIDPYAAQWLRNLIDAGHIARGDVDERSIVDVRPAELASYTQCHFFAGIGGWSLALRLAGWPDDRPVWTGSCPCQPFSAAGKRKGAADARHLWPDWFRLIRELAPPIIFGEQVARAVGHHWFDAVAHDLEGEAYAIGAAVLPACSVGAPHLRERLWYVAHAVGAELRQQPGRRRWTNGAGAAVARDDGPPWPVADASIIAHGLHPAGAGERQEPEFGNRSSARHVADADRSNGHRRGGLLQVGWLGGTGEAGADASAWRTSWPAEPDLPRVAHGVPNRVVKLCGLGNAIVPQVAAEFIRACL